MSRTCLLVLCLQVSLTGVQAQSDSDANRQAASAESLRLNEEAIAHYRAGDNREAIRLQKKSVAILEEAYPSEQFPDGAPALPRRLINLGAILNAAGEPALPVAERALTLLETRYPRAKYPNGHPDLAAAYNGVGAVSLQAGEPKRAVELLERALAMRRTLYPKNRFPDGHMEISNTLNNLGRILAELGRYERSIELLTEHVRMVERLSPKESTAPLTGGLALAQSLLRAGRYDEARRFLERALEECRRRFPDGHPLLANVLSDLGTTNVMLGDPVQGVKFLEQAAGLYRKILPSETHPALAPVLGSLGSARIDTGDYVAARRDLEKAQAIKLALYPEREYPAGHQSLATGNYNLGRLHLKLGDRDNARRYLEMARAMEQKLYSVEKYPDGHPELTATLTALTELALEDGDWASAEDYAHQAVRIAKRFAPEGGDGNVLQLLARVGFASSMAGDDVRGRAASREALQMAERLFPTEEYPDGHPSLAIALNNLGEIDRTFGEIDRALQRFERALAIREKYYSPSQYPQGHPDLARSLVSVGATLRAAGLPEKALPYLQRAITMLRGLFPLKEYPQGHPVLAGAENSMGVTLMKLDRFREAHPHLKNALVIHERLHPDGSPELALVLNNLGMLEWELGNHKAAFEHLERDVALQRQAFPLERYPDGHPDLALSLRTMGELHLRAGNSDRARIFFDEAVTMFGKQIDRLASFAESSVLLTVGEKIRFAVAGLLESTDERSGAELKTYHQVWRAKAISTRAEERRHFATRLATGKGEKIWKELLAVRQRLASGLLMHGKDRDGLIRGLTGRRDELERSLRQELRQSVETVRTEELLPQDLLNSLPEGTAFVDIVQLSNVESQEGFRYVAFVLAAGKLSRITLGSGKKIDEALSAWLRWIDSDRSDATQSVEVGRLVWDPIAGALPPGTGTVWVSPDGHLGLLPWVALPGRVEGTRLLDERAVAVVPHGNFLANQFRAKSSGSPGDQSLVVGGVEYGSPSSERAFEFLPGTAREVEQLRSIARGDLEVMTGKEASAENVVRELRASRVAHLATHGFFAEKLYKADVGAFREQLQAWRFRNDRKTEWSGMGIRSPLGYCGLVLANGNQNASGLVTAEAIVELPLEGLQLAVLSACETGRGPVAVGEGTWGLPHAFHLAGCSNVIASLWPVNDEATAALMTKFYHGLWIEKQSPIDALRNAQLLVSNRPDLIPDLAGTRGAIRVTKALDVRPLPGEERPKAAPKRTPPRFWAGFVLSGVGK